MTKDKPKLILLKNVKRNIIYHRTFKRVFLMIDDFQTNEQIKELEKVINHLEKEITIHKHIEETLRKSEQRYQQLLESVTDYTYTVQVSNGQAIGTIHGAGCEAVTGYTPKDYADNPKLWYQMIHESDRPTVIKKISAILAGSSRLPIEHRLIHRNGSIRWVRHTILSSFNDKGELISYEGLIKDITDLKQAEEKLDLSNKRLRLYMEESPLAFLEWDDTFHVIEWNAACTQIFGYTREEAISRHAKDLILTPQVIDIVDNLFQSLMSQSGGHNSINENITKDGKLIICEWFNTTLTNEHGKAIGVASFIKDITEQKRMEVELAVHRDHLEELVTKRTLELEFEKNKAQQYLDIAGVILVAIDTNQTITLINQEGCKVLGYDADEIIGKNWFETFIPEPNRQTARAVFHQLMTGELKSYQYFENPILIKNGQKRLISWQNEILKDNNGQITGTLSSGKDITNQRKNEQYIISLNKNLIERADELQEANKELESFAYTVSHDLRAPLRHIDGYIELLQERISDNLDENSQHYLQEISYSAKLMGKLIDDLLSFSRTSRQQLFFNKLDLEKVTHTVIENIAPDIGSRKIEWQIGKLPMVIGDSSLMQIALTNLISNAVKFTRPRKIANIEINSQEKNAEITVYIRDNGVGFDPAYADKLFGVFQRLHHTNEFEGTGVGLATTQRIINRHGGRIWAESKLEHGATFYFTLPKYIKEESNENT